MPFTASHAAIILPLLKKRAFSVSGLLMGSMVPDFEFFIRLEAHVVHGHSFWPMFWLNIPTAIICITLFHLIVRNQLILNLPLYFGKKFQPFLSFDWVAYLKANYIKVAYSILVGNISHIFWDSFTHFNGFAVSKISFLNIEFYEIPLFLILQYGFSILGALAIWHFIAKMPGYRLNAFIPIKNKLGYWGIVFLITTLVYLLRYDVEDYKNFGAKVVFICAGFLVGLIVGSSYDILLSKGSLVYPKKYRTRKF